MSEYSIVKTDFEKQKKALKSFAEQPATSTELDRFTTSGTFSDFLTGGVFGLIDHKVTGEEVNKLVTELQACFSEINERDRKVIKEFGQVYETFEALDKGYIQGILIGVKSAEEASKEAKAAQKDIDDTIKALQLTVNKLQEFKSQINAYDHLNDIDDIWEQMNDSVTDIVAIKDDIISVSGLVATIKESFNEYRDKLNQIGHLMDVDYMWETVNSIEIDLKSNECIVENIKSVQQELSDSVEELKVTAEVLNSQKHSKEIDVAWDYSHELGTKIEEGDKRITDNEERLHHFDEKIQLVQNENMTLKNKISVAYIIAGSAMGLSVVQLILSILGII